MILVLFARCVVSCVISEHLDAELVSRALIIPGYKRGKPLQVMFHSDQSSQYDSRLFRQ